MPVSATPLGDRGPQVGSSYPPKSFAAAATSSNPFNFNIEAKISSKDGFPAVSFSQLDFSRADLALRLSLILKFSSGRPVIDTIRSHIKKRWGISSNVIVGIIDARHVMLQVSSEKDAIVALSRESCSIEGYFFKIYRTDNATASMTRLNLARACLEVDISTELPSQIWLERPDGTGQWQGIIYEKLPLYCKSCSLQGHDEKSCWKLNPELAHRKGGAAEIPNNQKDHPVDASTKTQNQVHTEPHWRPAKHRRSGPILQETTVSMSTRNENAANTLRLDNAFDVLNDRNEDEEVEVEKRSESGGVLENAEQMIHKMSDSRQSDGEELGDLCNTVMVIAHGVEGARPHNGLEENLLEIVDESQEEEGEMVPETPASTSIVSPSTVQDEVKSAQASGMVYSNGIEEEKVSKDIEQVECSSPSTSLLGEEEDDLLVQGDSVVIPPHQSQIDREAQLINTRWNIMRLETLEEREVNTIDREAELKSARMELMRLEALILPKRKSKRSVKKNKKYIESDANASPTF